LRNIERGLCYFYSFVNKGVPTLIYEFPAIVYWQTQNTSHSGSGTSLRGRGWEINCAKPSGSHKTNSSKKKRLLGAFQERQRSLFPESPKEWGTPTAIPIRQAFQTQETTR
jgi:hypothetical protein